jgi:transcriptional regulator with XRE-family HTH domain
MKHEAGWHLVAERVQQEIDRQGLSLRAVEIGTGLNFRTIKKLLAGEPMARRDRLSVLAQFLGWEGDAFERIRQGREPVPLDKPIPDDASAEELRFRAIERRMDRLEGLLEDALQPEGQRAPE